MMLYRDGLQTLAPAPTPNQSPRPSGDWLPAPKVRERLSLLLSLDALTDMTFPDGRFNSARSRASTTTSRPTSTPRTQPCTADAASGPDGVSATHAPVRVGRRVEAHAAAAERQDPAAARSGFPLARERAASAPSSPRRAKPAARADGGGRCSAGVRPAAPPPPRGSAGSRNAVPVGSGGGSSSSSPRGPSRQTAVDLRLQLLYALDRM
jgi:hypothetical protein